VTIFGRTQKRLRGLAAGAALGTLAIAAPALAQDSAWTFEATYTVDAIGPVAGDSPRTVSVLDNLDLIADLDLGKAIGWEGATLHGYVLSNQGDIPNDISGTLQGVDNIEVGRQGVRLYELWVEAPLGENTSILAGLYDLNSEFYANDSAGLLIAPPFGIGSELAATGPNGPSIFPSTALGVRINHDFDGGYLRGAVLNAHAGVPGDPDGVDTEFDDGALIIGEVGFGGDAGKIAFGAWRYTDDQDDIRDVTLLGDPVQRTAQGAYALGEKVLAGDDQSRRTTAFFRVGFSDGRTGPFKGGWQAGVLVERVFESRPDSAFSVGIQQGLLSSRMQDIMTIGGIDASDAESGIEFSYSDRLTSRISIQPDLQVIFDAGGDRGADTQVVAGVRLTIDLLP
jgi:porin